MEELKEFKYKNGLNEDNEINEEDIIDYENLSIFMNNEDGEGEEMVVSSSKKNKKNNTKMEKENMVVEKRPKYDFLESIELKLLSRDDQRKLSVMEVNKDKIFDSNYDFEKGGLFDYRMGTLNRSRPEKPCKTCGHFIGHCTGHFGRIEFPIPIFHISRLEEITDILKCICLFCGRLLINKKEREILEKIKDIKKLLKQTLLFSKKKLFCNEKDNSICCNHEIPTIKYINKVKIEVIFQKEEELIQFGKLMLSLSSYDDLVFEDYLTKNLDNISNKEEEEEDDNNINKKQKPINIIEEIDFIEPIKNGNDDEKEFFKVPLNKNEIFYDHSTIEHPFLYSLINNNSYLQQQISNTTNSLGNNNKKKSFVINSFEVSKIFYKIKNKDLKFLSFNKKIKPIDLLVRTLLVPPPCMRPNSKSYLMEKKEDGLTLVLKLIIKHRNDFINRKNELKNCKNDKERFILIDQINNIVKLINTHVSLYFNDSIANKEEYKSLRKFAKKVKGIETRIGGGKEGDMRKNLMGKRSDFTVRVVITPDPNISITEIGVPYFIAMKICKAEKVCIYNIEYLQSCVDNGPNKVIGANYIEKDGLFFEIIKDRKIILDYSMTVYRHLKDGDIWMCNRMPSLHKFSIMGHIIKLMTGKSFRFEPCVMPTYGGDFDGDEMHGAPAQSYPAQAEVNELMGLKHNLNNPQSNKNTFGLVQDYLVGIYCLTKKDCFIEKDMVFQLIGFLKSFDFLKLPKPAIMKPKQLWTGKQLFEIIFPNDYYTEKTSLIFENNDFEIPKFDNNIDFENYKFTSYNIFDDEIVIRGGNLLCGILDKKNLSSSHGSILHGLTLDYNKDINIQIIDDLKNLGLPYFNELGLSIGISDIIVPEDRDEKTEKIIIKVNNEILKLQLELDNSEKVEENATRLLNDVRKLTSQDINFNNLSTEKQSTLRLLIDSGSKGSLVTLSQMQTSVGQQNIVGKRIRCDKRRCCYFPKSDQRAIQCGYVVSSYTKGLNPPEFFYHCMAGRVSLLDTTIKVPDTGYIQRRLAKANEDIRVNYDQTVRNGKFIVQFDYGEDNIDPSKVEKHNFFTFQKRNLPILQSEINSKKKFEEKLSFLSNFIFENIKKQLFENNNQQKITIIELPLDELKENNNNNSNNNMLLEEEDEDEKFSKYKLEEFKNFEQQINNLSKQELEENYNPDLESLKIIIENNINKILKNYNIFNNLEKRSDLYISFNCERYLQKYSNETLCIITKNILKENIFIGIDDLYISIIKINDIINKYKYKIIDHIIKNSTLRNQNYDNSSYEEKDEILKFHPILCYFNSWFNLINLILYGFHYKIDILEKLFQNLFKKFEQSYIEPSDNVGMLSAQSIGEPTTQLTLKTPHSIGQNEKNVTLGLPRLKEIQSIQKPSTPFMTLYFKKPYSQNSFFITNFAQKLIYCTLFNWVEEVSVLYQPNLFSDSLENNLSKDNEWLYDFYFGLNNINSTDSIIRNLFHFFNNENFLSLLKNYKNNNIQDQDFLLQPSINDDNNDTDNNYQQKLFKTIFEMTEKIFGKNFLNVNMISKMKKLIKLYQLRTNKKIKDMKETISSLVFRIKLSKEKLFMYNSNLLIVLETIQQHFKDRTFIYEYNIKENIIRMRPIFEYSTTNNINENSIKNKKIILSNSTPISQIYIENKVLKEITKIDIPFNLHNSFDFIFLKKIENYIFQIVVNGIKDIKNCFVKKETINDPNSDINYEYIIETEGSNLNDMKNFQEVDYSRIYSNNIQEMTDVFGIEVGRICLNQELTQVLTFGSSSYVNSHHISLLNENMTCRGYLMPINRHGINRIESSLWVKATFEETLNTFFKGARFNEKSKIQSVSDTIMVGGWCPIGTRTFDLLDDNKMKRKFEDESINNNNKKSKYY